MNNACSNDWNIFSSLSLVICVTASVEITHFVLVFMVSFNKKEIRKNGYQFNDIDPFDLSVCLLQAIFREISLDN